MLGFLVFIGFGVALALWRRRLGSEDAARRAGAWGEARVARELRRLGRAVTVWNDVHVRAGHRTSQIDHVVWTPQGLILIETKHWAGRLHVVSPTEWVQDNGRSRRVMHSPEHQSYYHEEVMREVLRRRHGLAGTPIASIVVLTHPNSRVYGPATLPCIRLRQLRRWLRRYTQPDPGIHMPAPEQLAALWSGEESSAQANRNAELTKS